GHLHRPAGEPDGVRHPAHLHLAYRDRPGRPDLPSRTATPARLGSPSSPELESSRPRGRWEGSPWAEPRWAGGRDWWCRGRDKRGRLSVSRFRRALAAATMAAAAVGGGLLIAAAGAVPAYASAASAPARGHTITITAHPRAASGIGPHTILPCAKKPGTAIKPASCGDQTITCVITANTPAVVGGSPKAVIATAETDCTSPVD